MSVFTFEKKERISIFPIMYKDVYEFVEGIMTMFWTPAEVKFDKDKSTIKNATEGEINLIKYIMAFFLTADTNIGKLIETVYLPLCVIPEHEAFEMQKAANENVHAQTYSKGAFELFGSNFEEINNHLQKDEAIIKKIKWINKWILDKKSTDAHKILAMAAYEMIGFQSLFCAIYNISEKGDYPGLKLSNVLISRDENLHGEFGLHLYNNYIADEYKLQPRDIHKMISDLIKTEEVFVKTALKYKVDGMSEESMMEYVKYVADNFLVKIDGIPRKYNTKNPFPMMNRQGLKTKSNFFEIRDSNYEKISDGELSGNESEDSIF